MDWSDAVILNLRAMWDEGLSTAEIGRRLGITKNAVVGKAHRLVLPARPSPIRRGLAAVVAPRRATGPTLPSMDVPDAVLPTSERVVEREAPPAVPRFVEVPVVSEPATRPAPVPAAQAAEPAMQAPRATVRAVQVLRPMATPRRTRVVACCWPIGEPGTRSFRFCDAESMAGKPYCESHAQLAYVKVRDRREDAA